MKEGGIFGIKGVLGRGLESEQGLEISGPLEQRLRKAGIGDLQASLELQLQIKLWIRKISAPKTLGCFMK